MSMPGTYFALLALLVFSGFFAVRSRAGRLLATASASLALMMSMPLGFAGVVALDVEAPDSGGQKTWLHQKEQVAAAYAA